MKREMRILWSNSNMLLYPPSPYLRRFSLEIALSDRLHDSGVTTRFYPVSEEKPF